MSGKQRNLRKKRDREDEEEDAAGASEELKRDTLEDIRLVQKLRKRNAGIDAGALAVRPSGEAAEDPPDADEDNELLDSYVKEQANQGSAMDEEKHMENFIERELAKRLGKSVDDGAQKLSKQELEEQALYQMPEGLTAQLTREVSIPGLITAITEVEVSKESKLKKIEETEALKRKLLAGNRSREDGDLEGGDMRVRRRDFAFSFGKQKKGAPEADLDPEELLAARKYISDRTIDPKDRGARGRRRGR